MRTLYDDIIAEEIPHASRESDLYVPDTPRVRQLLMRHGSRGERFQNRVEGGTWIDVPFAYMPFWRQRMT